MLKTDFCSIRFHYPVVKIPKTYPESEKQVQQKGLSQTIAETIAAIFVCLGAFL